MPRSPRLKHRLEVLLAGMWPAWASDGLAARLRALPGLLVAPVPVGQALGVITVEAQGEAALVLVQVERVDLDRAPAPQPPRLLAPEAVDALYDGARLALQLADQYDVLDVRRNLRFQVKQLDEAPLDVSSDIGGRSLGLSALVASWSLLAGQPVRTGLVFTGDVGAPGKGTSLRAMQHVSIKAREVSAAEALLVAPRANAGELSSTSGILVDDVAQALEAAFGLEWSSPARRPPPSGDPKTIEDSLERDYWEGRGGWAHLGERFERFSMREGLTPRRRARSLARAGACWTHLNDSDHATRLLGEARKLLASANDQLRRQDAVEISNHLAVFYRDAYRFDEAIQQLSAALKETDSQTEEAVQARSTLGQLLVCIGHWDEGLENVQAARDYYDAEQAVTCSRNHCYVIDALTRAGRLEAAREEHALGTRHNQARNAYAPDMRKRNQAFLDYARLNGELRALRGVRSPKAWDRLAALTEQLPGVADVGLWPGIGLERVRDAVRLRRLPSLLDRQAIVRSALLEADLPFPLFAWHRALVSVEAALSELERGGDWERARAWLENGLAKMPAIESARRFFAPYISHIHTHVGEPEALLAAIKALLDAEQY